ncbi:MAG: hypothetical protein J7501_12995 [Bdellovibrio sp.]|nr:hypothetical protein [Bdellovibrio sp.]
MRLSLISMDTFKLVNGLLSQDLETKEFARLCCRAGLCPVLLKAARKPPAYRKT